VIGTGVGFALSPTNTDSMSRVPPEMRAQVSGLIQTMRHVGGTMGLAVIGAVVIFVRTHVVAGHAESSRESVAISVAVGYAVGAAACAAAAITAVALHRRAAREPKP